MKKHIETVGVVGFGVMGSSMARNLARKGFKVFGYSRTARKVEALAADGIIPVNSPTELAKETSTVLTSISDGPALHDLLWGQGRLISQLPAGALVIDTTTISPTEAIEAGERCRADGIYFCDAPVTGGDVGARNGTLTIMCGGSDETISKARQFLECIGSKIVHVGPAGAGQRTKAVNQIAVALGIVAMTEALHFAEAQGLDVAKTLDILQGGAAGSWALSNYAPRILEGNLSPGFSAGHMLKDLRIALTEALPLCELPGTTTATELFARLVERYPNLGNHALIKAYDPLSLSDTSIEDRSKSS
jgi:3-hydroxyisobutyrate dehydrogenase